MPVIALNQASGRSHYSVVYFKERWDDDWILADDAVATDVSWGMSPDICQATIRVRYGLRIDRSPPLVEPRTDLNGWFVKILDVQSGNGFDTVIRKWFGYVIASAEEESGVRRVGNEYVESGRQFLRCIGLEDLLYRTTVLTTEFLYNSTQKTCERGLTFNRGGEPNRTTSTNPAPVFEGKPDADAKHWSSRTIVEYLLYYHVPQDANGNRNFIFDIDSAELAKIPKEDKPELRTHGETVGNILNQVINRYRQSGWWLELDEQTNHIQFKIARLHPDTIVLPASSEQMPGNSDKIDVNTFGDPSVRVRTNRKSTQQFHQFIYQGAPIRHLFNISGTDETVGDGWNSSQKTKWDSGGSGEAGFPASEEPRDRARFNRRVRAADELRDVYSLFQFPDDWDQAAGNGIGGTKSPIAEKDVSSGPFGSQQYFIYPPELSFCPTLPLLDNTTYHGQSASDWGKTVGKHPVEEQRPYIFVPVDESNHYANITQIGGDSDLEPEDVTKAMRWTGRVSVDHSGRGIRCEIQGADQYVIAKDSYTPVDHDEYEPIFDYKKFVFVVAAFDDRRCEGRYPAEDDLPTKYPNNDAIFRYVVYAGDDYRQDNALPNSHVTVDGVSRELKTGFGGYVRDDSGKLRDLARMSFEWYATPRRSITVATVNDDPNIALGKYVEDWQLDDEGNIEREVNSVITRIVRVFPIGQTNPPQVSRMTFTTSFEQFDPLKL